MFAVRSKISCRTTTTVGYEVFLRRNYAFRLILKLTTSNFQVIFWYLLDNDGRLTGVDEIT